MAKGCRREPEAWAEPNPDCDPRYVEAQTPGSSGFVRWDVGAPNDDVVLPVFEAWQRKL
jgi:hypothetical protein